MEENSEKKSGFFMMSFLVIFFISIAFGNVWFRTEVVKFEYALNKIISEKQLVEKEKEYLEAQYERLCSAKRVEKIAMKKLRMEVSNREEIVFIPHKSSISLVSFKKSN